MLMCWGICDISVMEGLASLSRGICVAEIRQGGFQSASKFEVLSFVTKAESSKPVVIVKWLKVD